MDRGIRYIESIDRVAAVGSEKAYGNLGLPIQIRSSLLAFPLQIQIAALSEDSWTTNTGWNEALLRWAARVGQLSLVESLISKFKSTPDLSRPSQWAAAKENLKVVERLLDMGAKVTSEPSWSMYHWEDPGILSGAALHGHEVVVQLLLARGADPNGEEAGMGGEKGVRPLGRAVLGWHLGLAKLLLKYGADPNLRPTMDENTSSSPGAEENQGNPPLTVAAYIGHLPMVELLLANGADPTWESSSDSWMDKSGEWRSSKDRWQKPNWWIYYSKRSALSSAIESGHEEIIEVLLRAGADTAMTDKNLPLAWAAMAGEIAMVDLLIKHGTGFELKELGETVLTVAARDGSAELVKLLIDRGVDVEGKDKDGRTTLSLAHMEGIFKILLDAGANVNSEDNSGRSPLCWATDLGVVKIFLNAKANVNSGQDTGRTPLIVAVKQREVEKVQLLLENGANINSRDICRSEAALLSARPTTEAETALGRIRKTCASKTQPRRARGLFRSKVPSSLFIQQNFISPNMWQIKLKYLC